MENDQGIFEHNARRMLWNYIMSEPGISLGSLARIMDMNRSTLRYHLDYLIRSKKVVSKIKSGQKCYFALEGHGASMTFGGVDFDTLPKTQRRVLGIIRSHPGVMKSELLAKTKIKVATLNYVLTKLVEKNLIWKAKQGRRVGYELKSKQAVKSEMFLALLDMFLEDEIDKGTFLRLKAEMEKRME